MDELKSLIKERNPQSILVVGKGKYIDSILRILDSDVVCYDIHQSYDMAIIDEISDEEIKILDKKNCFKISIDVPPGINRLNGKKGLVALFVDVVYSININSGLYLNDAFDYYNRIEGRRFLPKRKRNTNKGSYKKAIIIAGSKKYPGAALISANTLLSFKMGLGYQALGIPSSLFNIYALANPELLINPYPDCDGFFIYDDSYLEGILNYDIISLGMGMTRSSDLYKAIVFLLNNFQGILILDADALNSLAYYGVDVIKEKKCSLIITPHIKEFSRLSGIDVCDIENNPLVIAQEYARKYDVVLVLKSTSTIICDKEMFYINDSGNSGLAKASSGDMLVGAITGAVSFFDDITYSAYLGSYLVGYAAELSCDINNEYTVTASDIINKLPFALNEIIK